MQGRPLHSAFLGQGPAAAVTNCSLETLLLHAHPHSPHTRCAVAAQSELAKDPNGRRMLPAGESHLDAPHLHLARAFAAVVAASPRYVPRKPATLGSKELFRALFVSIRCAYQCSVSTAILLHAL